MKTWKNNRIQEHAPRSSAAGAPLNADGEIVRMPGPRDLGITS